MSNTDTRESDMSTKTGHATHVIEIDFKNELAQRVVVLTCMSYGLSNIADDLGRCAHCGSAAV